MDTQRCYRCKIVKPLTDFYRRSFKLRHGKRRIGHGYECKICRCAETKAFNKEHPEQKKARDLVARLKADYGITLEQHQAMHANQLGRCAICSEPIKQAGANSGKLGLSHVDHNHATHEVRGLLCSRCNIGIGMFKENTRVLAQAARYLEAGGAL